MVPSNPATPPVLPEISPRTRGMRLSSGKCPEHGITLVRKEPLMQEGREIGTIYRCPETGCEFDIVALASSRLAKLLR